MPIQLLPGFVQLAPSLGLQSQPRLLERRHEGPHCSHGLPAKLARREYVSCPWRSNLGLDLVELRSWGAGRYMESVEESIFGSYFVKTKYDSNTTYDQIKL